MCVKKCLICGYTVCKNINKSINKYTALYCNIKSVFLLQTIEQDLQIHLKSNCGLFRNIIQKSLALRALFY